MKRTLLLALLVIVASSFAFAQTRRSNRATDDARSAVAALNRRFVEAFNRGDAAAVAALYAMNARLLPPNSQMIEGRQNIQAFWQTAMSAGGARLQLETTHVESQGNLAYEVGRYTMTMPQPPTGQATTETGKYLVVLRRENGVWRLVADIWNANTPVAGQ